MSGLEVVGGFAAILQLVQAGAQIGSYITEIKKTRNHAETLKVSSQQVESIMTLAKSCLPSIPMIEKEARFCMNKAQAFNELLAKWRLEAPQDGKYKFGRRILAAVEWQSKEKEIISRWKELEGSMKILDFAASVQQLAERRTPVRGSKFDPILSDDSNPSYLHVKVYSAAQSPITMPLDDTTLPPRNPRFVGQESLLLEMEQKLRSGNCIALVGIGGTGKSQLAIEFAHRTRENTQQVWILFASAESELHLEQSYSRFAIDTKLATPDVPFSSQGQAVKNFLESTSAGRWLMIIDGADNAKVFYSSQQFFKLLPHTTRGSIIFTSRNLDVVRNFVRNEDDMIRLSRFSSDDAVKLFHSWLGGSKSSKFNADRVLELTEHLNGLPLALSQAASYIDRNCESVDEYIQLFNGSEADKILLLSEGGIYSDKSIDRPVAKTWLISFDRVKQENDFAAHLLCVAACLHHQQIPEDILPENQEQVKLKTALGLLKAHYLIDREPLRNAFDMHSLVHLMTRHWLRSRNQLEQYTKLALNATYELFPSAFRDPQEVSRGNRYSTHAQALLGDLLSSQYNERHAELASRLSRYLSLKGNYKHALPYLQQAVDMSKTIYGQQEPQTLTRQSEMAVLKLHLGEYQAAELLATHVRDRRKEILGDEHPETLAIQNNLALIYHAQGNYMHARDLQRQTYKTRKRTLKLSHEDTLKSLNNLGLTLKRLGQFEEAEEAFRKAFEERAKTQSKVNPDFLRVMNNLGLVLELRGKNQEALILHRTTLQGMEMLFGSKHLESLRSKQNIANSLTRQEEYDEAEAMLREVIQEYTELSLDSHHDSFFAQQRLVDVLKARGKYGESKDTCRQVFEARKAKLGEEHPETIFSRGQWEMLVSIIGELPE